MGDEDGIMTAKTSKVQLDSLICRSPSDVGQKGHEAGWRVTKGKRWVVCWGSIFTAAEFAGLHEFQRVNHFPGRPVNLDQVKQCATTERSIMMSQ
eukprot:scaffold91373_cov19-Tisochrysis_lutea.AAC.1